eukprot:g6277.t1
MFEAVKYLKSHGSDLMILSDANLFYINVVLKANGLENLFSPIVTNKAEWEDHEGREILRILPFHDEIKPHGCKLCPKNLCKGAVLKQFLKGKNYEKILYLGDGGGDVCPCLLLHSNDIVLARKGNKFALGQKLPKLLASREEQDIPKIEYWTNGQDVLNVVKKLYSFNK